MKKYNKRIIVPIDKLEKKYIAPLTIVITKVLSVELLNI